MIRPSILLAALVAVSQASLWASTAAAQDDDFYRGKTITIVIPIGPGGAYDAYARLVSRHMPKYLPGNPTMVARNMPGAGGVIASNYVYNNAPQDGTTLTIITSSFANEQVSGNPQIKYDARKFLAVGRLLDTTSVLFFWHASPIKTLDDMLTKPATVAISSIHEVPAYRLRAMNRFIGTSLKPIPGYPSARDYVLAAERGETDGGTSTFIGLSQLFSAHLKEKKLNILVQFATKRSSDMPDMPTVIELAKDTGGEADFPAARQQRRDRALALHHARTCRPRGSRCCVPRFRRCWPMRISAPRPRSSGCRSRRGQAKRCSKRLSTCLPWRPRRSPRSGN